MAHSVLLLRFPSAACVLSTLPVRNNVSWFRVAAAVVPSQGICGSFSDAVVRVIWRATLPKRGNSAVESLSTRTLTRRARSFSLNRTQASLPMKKGRAGSMTHYYQHNGTTTLFAALNVATGEVLGTCLPHHRHHEFGG